MKSMGSHFPIPFMATLRLLSLVLKRAVDHAAADLDDQAAEQGGIHARVDLYILADRALSVSDSICICSGVRACAVATSAVTSPRSRAVSARKLLNMSATAYSRRLRAISLTKLAVRPERPASRAGRRAPWRLVVGRDTGLCTSRRKSSLLVQHGPGRALTFGPRPSSGLPLILGQLEQCGSVAPRHASHHGIFCRHVENPSPRKEIGPGSAAAAKACATTNPRGRQAACARPVSAPAHTMRLRGAATRARVYGMPQRRPSSAVMPCHWPRQGLSFATRIRRSGIGLLDGAFGVLQRSSCRGP